MKSCVQNAYSVLIRMRPVAIVKILPTQNCVQIERVRVVTAFVTRSCKADEVITSSATFTLRSAKNLVNTRKIKDLFGNIKTNQSCVKCRKLPCFTTRFCVKVEYSFA